MLEIIIAFSVVCAIILLLWVAILYTPMPSSYIEKLEAERKTIDVFNASVYVTKCACGTNKMLVGLHDDIMFDPITTQMKYKSKIDVCAMCSCHRTEKLETVQWDKLKNCEYKSL